jgi:hypothetical protein
VCGFTVGGPASASSMVAAVQVATQQIHFYFIFSHEFYDNDNHLIVRFLRCNLKENICFR